MTVPPKGYRKVFLMVSLRLIFQLYRLLKLTVVAMLKLYGDRTFGQ
ncbi:hypothetical protein [Microcoleus sp.]